MENTQWYVKFCGSPTGPYPQEKLQDWLDKGQISRTASVYHPKLGAWKAIHELGYFTIQTNKNSIKEKLGATPNYIFPTKPFPKKKAEILKEKKIKQELLEEKRNSEHIELKRLKKKSHSIKNWTKELKIEKKTLSPVRKIIVQKQAIIQRATNQKLIEREILEAKKQAIERKQPEKEKTYQTSKLEEKWKNRQAIQVIENTAKELHEIKNSLKKTLEEKQSILKELTLEKEGKKQVLQKITIIQNSLIKEEEATISVRKELDIEKAEKEKAIKELKLSKNYLSEIKKEKNFILKELSTVKNLVEELEEEKKQVLQKITVIQNSLIKEEGATISATKELYIEKAEKEKAIKELKLSKNYLSEIKKEKNFILKELSTVKNLVEKLEEEKKKLSQELELVKKEQELSLRVAFAKESALERAAAKRKVIQETEVLNFSTFSKPRVKELSIPSLEPSYKAKTPSYKQQYPKLLSLQKFLSFISIILLGALIWILKSENPTTLLQKKEFSKEEFQKEKVLEKKETLSPPLKIEKKSKKITPSAKLPHWELPTRPQRK